MKMMERLLRNVGRSWDKIPKELPVLFVNKGTGVHPFMTVENNQLHLHTLPYQPDLPVKQSILLEDLTLNELVSTLRTMGYEASVLPEAVKAGVEKRKSFTLMDVKNRPISNGNTLETFTSKLWEMLYPLARLLQDTDQDIDRAIQEMFLNNTKGRWLDYWASFFGLKRALSESDETLRKRILLTFTNIKTNDVAIEELINFSVQGKVKIEDYTPAKFLINVSPEFMDEASMIWSIVDSIKGAGIDYVLYYKTTQHENYRSYLQDKTGKEFQHGDVLNGGMETSFEELRYGYTAIDMKRAFKLNSDLIGSSKVLSPWYQSKLEDALEVSLDFSEEYVINRKQALEGSSFFRLNQGKIGNPLNPLYGKNLYGDIIDTVLIELLEDAFIEPLEQSGMEASSNHTERYSEPMRKGVIGFRLGASAIGASARLSKQEKRILEGGGMYLEQDGEILREISF